MNKKIKKYQSDLNTLTIEEKEAGWVICETNHIEKQLKKIISHYIQPDIDKRHFVDNILLHNTNINLGAKIKVFFYICKLKGWKIENKDVYHKLLNYRNGFAHSDVTTKKVDVIFDENRKPKDVDIYMTINNVTYSGGFYEEKRSKVFQEFSSVCEQIKTEINNILLKIENS
ncbi:MAG: hypothetical protein PHU64_07000 [Candidatus Omnitrophica bacterium]|nr:hypothetical protein [Candidatus Omnitrophota bacterium]MDD5430214.1 hypothetical protein [Candidatus Omnitrophota bacterium]